MNVRVDAGSTCARSSLHAMSRAIASCAAADGFVLPYVPSKRDPHRAGVEPERVSPDHVAVDASVPALVDRAEAIDEEVVADVVPAVRLARGRAGSRARWRRPERACSRSGPPCGGRSRTSRRARTPAGRDGSTRSPPTPSAGRSTARPCAAGVLTGTLVAGLQTRCARTAATSPVVRASIRSEAPAHQGLPSRQPRRRCSCDPESGPSSASGAASVPRAPTAAE